MARIEMGTDAIERHAEKLEMLPHEIMMAFDLALDEMEKKIEAKLFEQLARYGLLGTNLAGKIQVYRLGTGISINVNNEYWTFVEYGTGIVGKNNPHPQPEPSWIYDSMGHGTMGWWYPTDDDDPNPVKRRNTETGQLFAFTKGQRARPFMYNTWIYATRAFTPIVMKHQRNIIKRRMG